MPAKDNGNEQEKRSEAQTPLLATAHTSGRQSTVSEPAHSSDKWPVVLTELGI